VSAPEYVTEISVTASADRNGWRLCSGMNQPEPLPDPEPEPEPEAGR
jgi:hypothetical protein